MNLKEFNNLKADIKTPIEDPCATCGQKSDYGVHSVTKDGVEHIYYCHKHYLSEVKYRGRKNKHH